MQASLTLQTLRTQKVTSQSFPAFPGTPKGNSLKDLSMWATQGGGEPIKTAVTGRDFSQPVSHSPVSLELLSSSPQSPLLSPNILGVWKGKF